MNFKQRLVNTAIGIFDWIIQYLIHLPLQRYLYRHYFPNARRSMDEMHKNFSFIFTNHHVSFSSPRPYLPTIIEIGGVHVKPSSKKLPQEFQDYIDSAKDGVILFSMGSYIDGTDWSEDRREAFVRIFGKLKQKVIWRYSNETLPNNPGNIKIASWLPQRDILAHKNVRVFITHGGLLGTTEALIEGVPVLGIPIFGDQMVTKWE
jgi:glucuronosyltransferase